MYACLLLIIVIFALFALKLCKMPIFDAVEKYIDEAVETVDDDDVLDDEEKERFEQQKEEQELEQEKEQEKVVIHVKTPQYNAEIVETGDEKLGRCMKMDGRTQWCEYDEYTRHETLVHGAIAYLGAGNGGDEGGGGPKRVLIVGGSDCMALREVVKYEQLERVIIIDDDERLKSLCEEHLGANAHRGDPRVTWIHLPIMDAIKKQPANTFDLIVVDVKDRPNTRNITISPSTMTELRIRLKQGGVLVVANSSSKPLLEDIFSYTHTLLFPSHATNNIEKVILCSDTIDMAKKKITGAFLDVNKIFTKFYRPTQASNTASAMLSTLIPARVEAPVTTDRI